MPSSAAALHDPIVRPLPCILHALGHVRNNNGKNLHELLVDTDMHASVSEGKICDTVVKMVETDGWRLTESGDAEETLYHMYQKPQKQKVRLHYIPYYTWANRGENEMQVWTRVQNP